MSTSPERVQLFRKRVIEWYRQHGDLDLPWRSTSDPWAILLAALLLRKTTTKQVIMVYEELLKRYPSPSALLSAKVEELERLIKPLGIEHQRARHLIELAHHIAKRFGGTVPCSKDKLKELPGVGDYIASEVLLAACDQPEPLLDRNMIRVLERVFGVKSTKPRPHTDPMLWRFAKQLVPPDPQEARDFNYGVLDFARKMCSAKNPKCASCILMDLCNYLKKTFKRDS